MSRKNQNKKKFSKILSEFKIYIGIVFCIALIAFVVFLNFQNKNNGLNISKIEKVLTNNKVNVLDEKIAKNDLNISKKKDSNLENTKNKKALTIADVLEDIPEIKAMDLNSSLENNSSRKIEFIENTEPKLEENLSKISSSTLDILPKNEAKEELKEELKKESQKEDKKSVQKETQNKAKKEVKDKNTTLKNNKSKLVIIMDDIASRKQIEGIRKLNLRITPSILPPTKYHPNSNKLSYGLDFYMVHLPLSALYFKGSEENTLSPRSSLEQINNRIKTIKNQFPNLVYINNHTGSEFTSNYKATKMLLKVLKANDIKFLDSVTIGNTKVKQVSKELGLRYMYRDVFLDNVKDKNAILSQLKKAVKIANKKGVSIAICHPYKVTFLALKSAKNNILKNVELIYLKDAYGFYN